ncbi:MAG: GNAT family N-acetyltransferase [Alphaproteobacteria bacterium]|nr:GNAT family N-acetyltransferase [Alphaproteobacteria bacterium]
MIAPKENLLLSIIPATIEDYPTIQNMARFYVYEMTRTCGFISDDWHCPKDGLYESFDFKIYFEAPDRFPFIVKIGDELAGFVLINKVGVSPNTQWNMGEFFILAKFQGKGIAKQVANMIWQKFPGIWEVLVIPEMAYALKFWRKTINPFTNSHYTEDYKLVRFDRDQPNRFIFTFDTSFIKDKIPIKPVISKAETSHIDAMILLSDAKRESYEKVQPQFWKRADNAHEKQTEWFHALLNQPDHILLVAEINNKIKGFIIGRLIPAPEVYNPGGLTLMIDDFCVAEPSMWQSIGAALLFELKKQAKLKNVSQILVVCGHHDKPKKTFLDEMNLSIASNWYVGNI